MTNATPFIGQILAMRARRCRPPRRRVFKLDLPRVIGEPRNGLTPTMRRLLGDLFEDLNGSRYAERE